MKEKIINWLKIMFVSISVLLIIAMLSRIVYIALFYLFKIFYGISFYTLLLDKIYLFSVFFSTSIITLVSYIIFSKFQNFLKNHELPLTIMTIFIAINIFLYPEALDVIKYEVSLKEENNRNIAYLKIAISSLENNQDNIIWRDFQVDKYYGYWDYIHLNYSPECKDWYAQITDQLIILNNINEMRKNSLLNKNNDLFARTSKEIISNVSNTLPVFYQIVGSCQKL